MSLSSIHTKNAIVHFNEAVYTSLNSFVKAHNSSKIFILVDENTHTHCLPLLLSNLETNYEIEIIEIDSGEVYKTIDTCMGVWGALSELGADRKSLLINLGGGVVTDLGGFVACTYKRGIDYINVPTTLLSMVDASVGGKTGVDLGTLKNQIGVISEPKLVLVDTQFLKTLPENQLRSGMAEMLKHGLIADLDYWNQLKDPLNITFANLDAHIYRSVEIKNAVVSEDPTEQGQRKILNFGHTLGHAIESYFMDSENKQDLLHGEAIAVGMILEAYLSKHYFNFPEADLYAVAKSFLAIFQKVNILEDDIDAIIDLMKYDKKNSHGNVKFVLLKSIGTPVIDVEVDNSVIYDAFSFYSQLEDKC